MKESWEQTRMIMYAVLLPYSEKNKQLKPADVMCLPWELDVSKTNNKLKSKKELEEFWRKVDKK